MINKNKLFYKMDTGLSLRTIMKKHKLKVKVLVSDLGVSDQTMTVLRYGKQMSGKNIDIISKYFGVKPSYFLELGETIAEQD